jgi:dolichol-phosphate mannosyltransferase
VISVSGIAFSALAGLSFLAFAAVWFTRGVPFAGFGTLVSLALLGFGVLTTMLGTIAEYMSLIYEEVKGRPNFVVRDATGIEHPNR